MANKDLFQSTKSQIPAADAVNEAGGKAYSLTAEEALAQIASTGTFNKTYYGEGSDQLAAIKRAADEVTPTFLAQCALHARRKGGMKDVPAALVVMLTKADSTIADVVFDRVIDNGKQIRNYVQMTCSGALGRKGFSGSAPKRLVARWLNRRTPEQLLRASVGNDPSLSSIIRLAHPKPTDDERRALYGYLRGLDAAGPDDALLTEVTVEGRDKPRRVPRYRASHLPAAVAHLESFRRGETKEVPKVDFRLLAGLPLSKEQWAEVARGGRIMQTFRNLNTYARHGAFDVPGLAAAVASKLRDREEIKGARLFPYQLLAAYANTETPPVPFEVRDALQDAMEAATEKVESYGVPVAVVVDVSGSMQSPVTGHRKGATSKVRCIDVAGLVGATVLRKNPGSVILPTDVDVFEHKINPRDSIMTIATQLASYGGGGTNLSAALRWLNQRGWRGGLILVVSDMESWVDSGSNYRYYGQGTGTMSEFRDFQKRNPGAKMACLDIQPHGTTQAPSGGDVLNIGGFSDSVFETIGRFVRGEVEGKKIEATDASAWVREIKAIDILTYGLETTEESDEPVDSSEDPS